MFLSIYSYDSESHDLAYSLASSYLRRHYLGIEYKGLCPPVFYDNHGSYDSSRVVVLELDDSQYDLLVPELGIHEYRGLWTYVLASLRRPSLPMDAFMVTLYRSGLSPYGGANVSLELVHRDTGRSLVVNARSHRLALGIAVPLLSSYLEQPIPLDLVRSYGSNEFLEFT